MKALTALVQARVYNASEQIRSGRQALNSDVRARNFDLKKT
jgi:hypothetical protein